MSVRAKRCVELFYDVVSPYSWIGFEVMCRYANKWNVDLKLKPCFLGGIMQAADNRPPGFVQSKAVHMIKDLARLREHYKIPVNQPSDVGDVLFNKGSLAAMRFVTAVDMQHPQFTESVSRALWMRIWSRDEDITEPQSLFDAGKEGGLDEDAAKETVGKIKDDAIKNRLKLFTKEAIDYKAFGAPTFLVEDTNGEKQMIFGSDRFHIIADILGEKYEGPLTELAKSKM